MTTQPLKSKELVGTVRDETSLASKVITLVAVVVPPLGVVAAAIGLWGIAVGWFDIAVLAVLYTACGLGITVGFHRLFSHKSFKTKPAIRALFAILGSMTIQGPLTQWVTDHRKHHAMSDDHGDPHSPHVGRDGEHGGLSGLWWAHMGWLFRTKGMERGDRWGRDLYEDRLIRTIDRLYMLWVLLSVGIPFVAGYLFYGSADLRRRLAQQPPRLPRLGPPRRRPPPDRRLGGHDHPPGAPRPGLGRQAHGARTPRRPPPRRQLVRRHPPANLSGRETAPGGEYPARALVVSTVGHDPARRRPLTRAPGETS